MKKPTDFIVRKSRKDAFKNRSRSIGGGTKRGLARKFRGGWINNRVKRLGELGLLYSVGRKKNITLMLPSRMDFSKNFNSTVLYISAIRLLAKRKSTDRLAYRLASVIFDGLRSISTSAALVLTAELSKWDDEIRQRLRPTIDGWDKNILKKFYDLGFFDLFTKKPSRSLIESISNVDDGIVKYIKGQCEDAEKTTVLKDEIARIVGDRITKWTFLYCGLSEAITNVSHHAYPDKSGFSGQDKNWYLTGSFSKSTRELKIAFYDQGIGIPKSLPATKAGEYILNMLSGISSIEKKRDEVLLKAAVELGRTRTEEIDRGKGLQDLLEFIRQRGSGYLSIMSSKGLYKLSIEDGVEIIKSVGLASAIDGTLIIWSVKL